MCRRGAQVRGLLAVYDRPRERQVNPARFLVVSSRSRSGMASYEIGEGLTGWTAKHKRAIRVTNPSGGSEMAGSASGTALG